MQVEYAASFIHKEIIYMTKDMAIFHNFYYKPLIAFRYYFWMKSIIQDPGFADKDFATSILSEESEKLSQKLVNAYNKVPSTEIWNTECINATISQIEFYKESGLFISSKDIKTIYEALEETVIHLKNEAEYRTSSCPVKTRNRKKAIFVFFIIE